MSQGFTKARGQAPVDATYIVKTANSNLTAEQALSTLATGYMKVTTGTGTITSQAVPIPVADGGTGATSFTTNGIIYKGATALASTAAGTTGTILKGNTGAAPTFGAISLTADVTGTLPVENGGTEATSFTSNGVLYGNATGAIQVTAAGASNTVLHGNTGVAPSYSAVSLTADVTGTLPIARGGTNNSSAYTAGSVVFSNGTSLTQNNAQLFWDDTNNHLLLGGTAAATADIVLKADGSAVFNEQGNDADFRIEGDTATQLFVVDAGLDAVQVGTTTAGVIADFRATGIVFNEDGSDRDFRVEGANESHLLFTDAAVDLVGVKNSTPSSTLHVDGGLATGVRTETANYTATGDDFLILGNPGVGVDITITLPAASGATGRIYHIKKINITAADTVTIDPNGAETIDGAATVVLSTQHSGRVIQSDGSNWFVMGST